MPLPQSSHKLEKSSPSDKSRVQRRCSWKLSGRPSLRRKKNRSGSDSDAIPLNNGRDHSQCNGGGVARHVSWASDAFLVRDEAARRDHLADCRTLLYFQASLRNDSLLQSTIRIQNDTQKDTPNNKSTKGLSPQNSLRSRSNTCSSVQQVSQCPLIASMTNIT